MSKNRGPIVFGIQDGGGRYSSRISSTEVCVQNENTNKIEETKQGSADITQGFANMHFKKMNFKERFPNSK